MHADNPEDLKNVAVLTTRSSWFVPYARSLVDSLVAQGRRCELLHRKQDVGPEFRIVFLLSYFNLVDEQFLKQRLHNIVVHASLLPRGKGWAPLFWQILEGKNDVPICLFEAAAGVDSGDIYLRDVIHLEGHELHDTIRHLQAEKMVDMCLRFLRDYERIQPVAQSGEESFYARRSPADSRLDVNRTIAEQFDRLRIASNEDYPAFFDYRGKRYVLKIFEGKEESGQ